MKSKSKPGKAPYWKMLREKAQSRKSLVAKQSKKGVTLLQFAKGQISAWSLGIGHLQAADTVSVSGSLSQQCFFRNPRFPEHTGTRSKFLPSGTNADRDQIEILAIKICNCIIP